ncbi:MAG TPA: NINE protein [Terracidiphilus sp.]|nr:NINE protein [Terracidiphilus sp.]
MSSVAYPNAQAIFYQQYEAVRRDEVVGILLALFLGSFGIHHFYLRRTGLGILYCCFFWTGIPAMLGFFECFFMPGRVREFNAIQAAGIAAALGMSVPPMGWPPVNVTVNMPAGAGGPAATGTSAVAPQPGTLIACSKCQRTNPPSARFCSGCGNAL